MKRILAAAILLLLTLFLLPVLLLSGRIPDPPPPISTSSADDFSRDKSLQFRLLTDAGIRTVSMDEYLFCVAAAEMPASFHSEALKAQVIAARTYALHKIECGPSGNHPDADLCTDSACCSAFITEAQAAQNWGPRAEEYTQKLRQAVSETDGQAVLYNGSPINAVFHSSSSGATEQAALVWGSDVPYLSSVASPENSSTVPNYESTVEISPDRFRTTLLEAVPEAVLDGPPETWFGMPEYSPAGKVLQIPVGGAAVTGRTLRSLFGLRSTAFSVTADADGIRFSVRGYGHGVGLSQYGANVYAGQGWDCEQILTWYYRGTTVSVPSPS